MLVTLRKRSQITIPTAIVAKLNLQENDLFNCLVEGENIILVRLKTTPLSPGETDAPAQPVLQQKGDDNKKKDG